jgi:UDP-N-acetylmuramoylalanine--D-glutamate ligase
LIPAARLALMGNHNALNALAALALLDAVGIPVDEKVLQALQEYRGLPHRCELVRTLGDMLFVNDSKATNVGAALAAMDGLTDYSGKIVLIAGGDSKGADLRPLGEAIRLHCAGLVLLGRDGEKIAEVAGPDVPTLRASDMPGAVLAARALAREEGVILLSPACSSLDMYENFEARGDAFRAAVEQLPS